VSLVAAVAVPNILRRCTLNYAGRLRRHTPMLRSLAPYTAYSGLEKPRALRAGALAEAVGFVVAHEPLP